MQEGDKSTTQKAADSTRSNTDKAQGEGKGYVESAQDTVGSAVNSASETLSNAGKCFPSTLPEKSCLRELNFSSLHKFHFNLADSLPCASRFHEEVNDSSFLFNFRGRWLMDEMVLVDRTRSLLSLTLLR